MTLMMKQMNAVVIVLVMDVQVIDQDQYRESYEAEEEEKADPLLVDA
jgi:hypothetical protein